MAAFVEPMALLIATKEVSAEYAARVANGRADAPAHRRKKSSVESIWRDLTSEFFLKVYGFGAADMMCLADVRRQDDVFARFVFEKPHLMMPQPSGVDVDRAIQAVWQGYVYLAAVGEEVLDRNTSKYDLAKKGTTIISDLEQRAEQAVGRWKEQSFDSGLPPFFIDLVYQDVNEKAKSIALSAQFGPVYESGIKQMLSLVAENGTLDDVRRVEESINRLLAAKTPDDIGARRAR
jgi:hypothetical protein